MVYKPHEKYRVIGTRNQSEIGVIKQLNAIVWGPHFVAMFSGISKSESDH